MFVHYHKPKHFSLLFMLLMSVNIFNSQALSILSTKMRAIWKMEI